jgi:hypothetical protein
MNRSVLQIVNHFIFCSFSLPESRQSALIGGKEKIKIRKTNPISKISKMP